jgi:hypothetical protein
MPQARMVAGVLARVAELDRSCTCIWRGCLAST